MPRRRHGPIGCALLAALVALTPSVFAQPAFSIEAPDAESYLVGDVVFRARAAGGVSRVDFFVDGQLACSASGSPFECSWDAGPTPRERLVRVVASLESGDRLVTTFQTKGLAVTETVSVNVVLVPTVVTDQRGQFVKNLTAESFAVFEDDASQEITTFQSESAPLEIVIAVDVSGSMADSMSELKRALREFVGTFSAGDVVTLVAFSDRLYTLAERESDTSRLLDLVDDLPDAYGGSAVRDAVLYSLEVLGEDIRRRAVLVFTDGEDRSSLVGAEPLMQQIRASDASLYFISQGRGSDVRDLRETMVELAEASGGRLFETERIVQLQAALEFVREVLSNQYLLGFSPATAGDGSYRRLRVEVPGSRYTVRARQGYRAQTPQQ